MLLSWSARAARDALRQWDPCPNTSGRRKKEAGGVSDTCSFSVCLKWLQFVASVWIPVQHPGMHQLMIQAVGAFLPTWRSGVSFRPLVNLFQPRSNAHWESEQYMGSIFVSLLPRKEVQS